MDTQESIEHLTRLFRSSDLPLWRRLRVVVRERGVEPETSILAVSFEDDVNFEYGVLVTGTRHVFQYGFSYVAPDGSDGTLSEWRDVTDTDLVSFPQRAAADLALSILTPNA